MIWLLENWPLAVIAGVSLVALLVIAVCVGISIGEGNVMAARHDAFLEGRRSERADNGREPL